VRKGGDGWKGFLGPVLFTTFRPEGDIKGLTGERGSLANADEAKVLLLAGKLSREGFESP